MSTPYAQLRAGKSVEVLFGAGDLDGLMDLYEPDAVFTNQHGAHVGSTARERASS